MARSLVRVSIVLAAILAAAALYVGCSDNECPTCPKDTPTGSLSLNVMHPQPEPLGYNDVFAVAPNDAFIAADAGKVLRWQDGKWTRYDTPVASNLRGIWGSSSDNVFAVGERGVVVHFDGSDWHSMDSGILHSLYGVWGATPDTVFAVGDNDVVLRYADNNWAPLEGWFPPGNRRYRDVWGTATDNIYFVGVDPDQSYTGVVARKMYYGGSMTWFGGTMNAVWCASPDTVYVGDSNGEVWRTVDGTNWVPFYRMGDAVRSIWGSSGNDIWAAGHFWHDVLFLSYGTLHHYNGTTWNDIAGTALDFPMLSLSGTSSNDVYLVGDGAQALEWNGLGWRSMSDVWATGHPLEAIWGFGSDDLWAFGGRGTIIHYDGADWSRPPSVFNESILACWAANPDTIYAVGGDSKIAFYDGNGWVDFVHPYNIGYLRSVWGTSANDIRIGGDNGQMLYYNGTDLVVEDLGDAGPGPIRDLWGSAPDDYYAVTYDGVLHYDGNTWTPISLGGRSLTSVHGVSATEVYFAGSLGGGVGDRAADDGPSKVAGPEGDMGFLLRYNGSTITEVATNFKMEPLDVWAVGSKNIFMSGRAGGQFAIGHYNGSGVTIGTNSATYRAGKLWASGNTAYAVGPEGMVVSTTAR